MPRTMSEALDNAADSGNYQRVRLADRETPSNSTNSNSTNSTNRVRSAGATLRRVPWQQMPSSCPNGSGMLLYQPPPPPPPAGKGCSPEVQRSNSSSSSRVNRTRSCTALAMTAPYGANAAVGHSNSSAGLTVQVQAQAPHPSRYQSPRSAHSASALPTLTHDQLLHSSWDGEGVGSPAISDAGMSSSTLWLASPSAAPQIISSSFRSHMQQGSMQQHLADRSRNSSNGTLDPARQQALLRGAQAGPAAAAGGQVAAGFSPWGVDTQQHGPESAHTSSSSSVYGDPLFTTVSAAPAQVAPAAAPMPVRALSVRGGRSSGSLAAVGDSWPGHDILGLSPSAEAPLQDSLASAHHADSHHVLGHSGAQVLMSSPLPTVLQSAQYCSPLTQYQQQQHKGLSHSLSGPLPSLDTSCPIDLDSTLALISQQLAAAHAGSGTVLSGSLLGTSLDGLGPGVLSAYGEGPGLPAYTEGLLSTSELSLHQQMQLASKTLGFAGSAGSGSASGPISIPSALHSGALLSAPATSTGAAAGGAELYVGWVPASLGASLRRHSNSAMVVAQLKLQQLMAVEQVQQQLQEEVLRLLPLI